MLSIQLLEGTLFISWGKKKNLSRYSGSIFFFFLSQGCTLCIWRFPGQGSNQSYSCRPTPQPQQSRIQATSVIYTTAHRNTRSLAHWARSGIELATSWFLVRFVSTVPGGELQVQFFFLFLIFIFCLFIGPHPQHMEVPRLGV